MIDARMPSSVSGKTCRLEYLGRPMGQLSRKHMSLGIKPAFLVCHAAQNVLKSKYLAAALKKKTLDNRIVRVCDRDLVTVWSNVIDAIVPLVWRAGTRRLIDLSVGYTKVHLVVDVVIV